MKIKDITEFLYGAEADEGEVAFLVEILAGSAGLTPQHSKEVSQGCRSPRLRLFQFLLMC
jgi:hypothetical protein